MKVLWGAKDGGLESKVWAYGFEWKRLFSVILLKFEDGTRDAYHSHAFNAISCVISGKLTERFVWGGRPRTYSTSNPVVYTYRTDFHQVESTGRSWVLTLRGPWAKVWDEFVPADGMVYKLSNGRKVVKCG